jgi:hypothetical protein
MISVFIFSSFLHLSFTSSLNSSEPLNVQLCSYLCTLPVFGDHTGRINGMKKAKEKKKERRGK